jgi:3-isopropylmalate/(R)-2-methylmalate dehydratase small subunit
VVVADQFARTFYRNGHEVGLPILEAPGIHDLVETGDRLRVDIEKGTVLNRTSGKSLTTVPAPDFLLDMLRAGGLIAFLKGGGVLQQ